LIRGEPTKVIKTRDFQVFVTKCNLLVILLTNHKIHKNPFFHKKYFEKMKNGHFKMSIFQNPGGLLFFPFLSVFTSREL